MFIMVFEYHCVDPLVMVHETYEEAEEHANREIKLGGPKRITIHRSVDKFIHCQKQIFVWEKTNA